MVIEDDGRVAKPLIYSAQICSHTDVHGYNFEVQSAIIYRLISDSHFEISVSFMPLMPWSRVSAVD